MNKLLMTGTIDSSAFNNTGTVLSNTLDRLVQYESAIERYIKFSDFKYIVFSDNSGYKFEYEKFKTMAQKYNKEFEFISLPGYYNETLKYGKSYGESRLITDTINQSTLINDNDVIFKVTGRVYVNNINKLIKKMENDNNIFVSYNRSNRVLTHFFKVSVCDYKKTLSDAYMDCNDKIYRDIESVYYDRLLKNKVDVKCFKYYPDLDGVIGGMGIKYNKSKLNLLIRNILIRLGFFTLRKGNWGM